MGNRGLLHGRDQAIRREWRLKAWLICRLEFNDRRRTVMSPGLYTELFFLDEATALAAGHRPCAECRRQDYLAFKSAAGFAESKVGPMDEVLHAQRLDQRGGKPTWRAKSADLPAGCLVAIDGQAWLTRSRRLHLWTPEGYTDERALAGEVNVLTPRLTVDAIRRGYAPQVALD